MKERLKVYALGLLSIAPMFFFFMGEPIFGDQTTARLLTSALALPLGGFFTLKVWSNHRDSWSKKLAWTVFLLLFFAPYGIFAFWVQRIYRPWREAHAHATFARLASE